MAAIITKKLHKVLGPIPVSRFSENSEFVNREMGETLGFLFQKEKSLKLWVSYDGNILCEHNLLAGRFTSTTPEFSPLS